MLHYRDAALDCYCPCMRMSCISPTLMYYRLRELASAHACSAPVRVSLSSAVLVAAAEEEYDGCDHMTACGGASDMLVCVAWGLLGSSSASISAGRAAPARHRCAGGGRGCSAGRCWGAAPCQVVACTTSIVRRAPEPWGGPPWLQALTPPSPSQPAAPSLRPRDNSHLHSHHIVKLHLHHRNTSRESS